MEMRSTLIWYKSQGRNIAGVNAVNVVNKNKVYIYPAAFCISITSFSNPISEYAYKKVVYQDLDAG